MRANWKLKFLAHGISTTGEVAAYTKTARRQQRQQIVPARKKASATTPFDPLWLSGCEAEDAAEIHAPCSAMPFSEVVLRQVFNEVYDGKITSLRQVASGESPHTIVSDVPSRSATLDAAPAEDLYLVGCQGRLVNICDRTKTPTFNAITKALSRWVDGLGADARNSGEHVLACTLAEPGNPEDARRTLFLLFGLHSLNPKVQTFVVCKPLPLLDEDNKDPFSPTVPPFPFELLTCSAPSRLCCPSHGNAFMVLWHMTSDEVAMHLTKVGQHWRCRQMTPPLKSGSLLVMCPSEWSGDSFPLTSRDASTNRKSDDDFLGGLKACCLGDPCERGEARAEASVARSHCLLPKDSLTLGSSAPADSAWEDLGLGSEDPIPSSAAAIVTDIVGDAFATAAGVGDVGAASADDDASTPKPHK